MEIIKKSSSSLSCGRTNSLEEQQLIEYITNTDAKTDDISSTEMMMERYLELKIPESYHVKFNFTPEK